MAYKDSAIKVLMMGAARVGKTSLLASMCEENVLNEVTKGTKLKLIANPSDDIKAAGERMKNYFDFSKPHEDGSVKRTFTDFKFARGGDSNPREFTVDIAYTGGRGNSKSRYSIGFRDIPGEYIDEYAVGNLVEGKKEDLEKWIIDSDVLLITIDSILLMEDEGINDDANRVTDICNLVTEYCEKNEESENSRKNKLILFVPTKTEKYFHIHQEELGAVAKGKDIMTEMNDRIKEKYADIFDYCADKNDLYEIVITPIMTLGNIEFSKYESMETEKWAENMLFRYYYSDPSAVARDEKPTYAPQFCDQPLVYILYYELLNIKRFISKLSILDKIWINLIDSMRRLSNDRDLLPEMESLKKNIKQNVAKDGYYVSEVVQDPIGIMAKDE